MAKTRNDYLTARGVSGSVKSCELVFIDPSIPDLDILLSGLRAGIDAILLSPSSSALEQIAAFLRNRHEYDAIHIVAHGRPGEVSFSSGALNLSTVEDQAAELTEISAALGAAGALLLWSCEVGAGKRGSAFIEALTRAT